MERRDKDTPCSRCPKSRDGRTPNPNGELSAKNWRCYQYYLASRAGLTVEADAVTRRNFALIQLAHERAEAGRSRDVQRQTAALSGLAAVLARK